MLTNLIRPKHRFAVTSSAILLLFPIFTGCGSIQLPKSLEGFTPVSKTDVETEQPAKSRGSFEVMLKPRFGKGSKSTIPIDEAVVLQDVIEQSGAIKKFKAMEITIYRPVKGSPVPLQMQCEYDSAEDSVPDSENYEIYPGDQVLLEEVSGSRVGKLIGDLSPLDR